MTAWIVEGEERPAVVGWDNDFVQPLIVEKGMEGLIK